MGLKISSSSQSQVLVGNRERLNCTSMSSNIPIQLGDNHFSFDLFVLPIIGVEAVLGIQCWTLGPIITDYANLTMSFTWQGKAIHLPTVEEVSSSQLKRLHDTNSIAAFYQL